MRLVRNEEGGLRTAPRNDQKSDRLDGHLVVVMLTPSSPAAVMVKVSAPRGSRVRLGAWRSLSGAVSPGYSQGGGRVNLQRVVKSNGRADLRRGNARQSSSARADPAPNGQGAVPAWFMANWTGLAWAAVVAMDMVVEPPPRSLAGWAPAGGVQPKLSVRLKPPTWPGNMTTCLHGPAFRISVCEAMTRL